MSSGDRRLIGLHGRRATGHPEPQRFQEHEWKGSLALRHKSAEAGQELSERLMAESMRVANETEESRLRGQTEVNWHLNQRVQDIQIWIQELSLKCDEVNERMEELKCYNQRVKEALNSLPKIVEVDNLILRHREGRIGIELVNDEPQKEIHRELNLTNNFKEMSTQWIKNGDETLRILRKFWIQICGDLENKKTALKIDTLAISLNQHSLQVQRQDVTKIQDYSHLDNESEWEEIAAKYKKSADNILQRSATFQLQVQSFLRQFCEQLQNQVCQTNAALEKKLVEVRQAKSKLEEQHNQISIRIREMENVIDKMSKSVEEKESSIALTETRLSVRNQRPKGELVKDIVQRRLHVELIDLNNSKGRMILQLNQSRIGLRNLLAQQVRLHEDINLKVRSIAIDETQVMPLRKTIHITNH